MEEPETCTCDHCKSMCKRPCWPTPEEALTLMQMGRAGEMMLDYWEGSARGGEDWGRVEIICPASPHHCGEEAPRQPNTGCVMQTDDGLCKLHDICKPLEARMATCKKGENSPNWHHEIAIMWESNEGETVVQLWKEEMGWNDD